MSPAVPEAGAPVDPLALLTGYQGATIVATATRTGVADALAEGIGTADAIAAHAGLNARGVRGLLGALEALGLAERDGVDGGHRLTEAGAVLARSHPQTVGTIVDKEWFFYGVWGTLDEAIRDGHARIPPWRDRLRDDVGQSHTFLRALDDLAARFGGELPGLAGLAEGGRLLDVGGGAGSHAARLAAAVPGLEPVVLDLPETEVILRERHPELPFVAGDLDAPRFGRPGGEAWDVVLLANILHDNPPAACARLVAEAAGLLEPGGTLLLYEWVLDDTGASPAPVALFDLMMLVENEGGASHTAGAITGWLEAAGLSKVEIHRGFGPIAVVRATR